MSGFVCIRIPFFIMVFFFVCLSSVYMLEHFRIHGIFLIGGEIKKNRTHALEVQKKINY